jgi:hypothetical protein
MYSDHGRRYRGHAADCLLKAEIFSQKDEWRRVAKIWETLALMHEDVPAISLGPQQPRRVRDSVERSLRRPEQRPPIDGPRALGRGLTNHAKNASRRMTPHGRLHSVEVGLRRQVFAPRGALKSFWTTASKAIKEPSDAMSS